jgi:heme-degrading monooxygenase HmoA
MRSGAGPRARRRFTCTQWVSTLDLDPARIDDVVRQLEERDLPMWRDLDGFRGFTLVADRSSGKVIGTSYWDSEGQMNASEEAVKDARRRAAETGGMSGEPRVERFEVVLDTFVPRT